MDIKAVDRSVDVAGAVILIGVMAGLEPAPGSETVFAALDPGALAAASFDGSSGQRLSQPHPTAKSVVAIGLGEETSFSQLRSAVGDAIRVIKAERVVCYLALLDLDNATRAVVEGALLGSYVFNRYKTSPDANSLVTFDLVGADQAEIDRSQVMASETNHARDWVNTPAGDMSPSTFADTVGALAVDAGLEVDVWDESRIAGEGLGAILGVAAGSERPPRLVILRHRPEDPAMHLGLVGKGITFDSGGLSIKPAKAMEEMKDDMAGAAAVAAATIAIAQLDLPVKVTAVLPLSDNVIGGNAIRPGDVLRPLAGPTVEVLNTDAEGRLVLADGLGVLARESPDLTIDVATLTGAAHIALGDQIAALFASDSEVAALVLDASARAGEPFWELPLFEPYRKSLDSGIADIKSTTGSRYGGAIAAALFLSNYAGDGPWAHLDIAGPARSTETSGELVKGGSGFGVRTIVEIAQAVVEAP